MADPFKFELAVPERLLIEADALQVLVPGAEGDFTVLANHAPVVTTLRPGILDITLQAARKRLLVKDGFVEAAPDRLTVLVSEAVDVEELTPARVAAELERAEAGLASAKDDHARRMAHALAERLRALQAREGAR